MRWDALSDLSGSAAEIPSLLDRAASDDIDTRGHAWRELRDRSLDVGVHPIAEQLVPAVIERMVEGRVLAVEALRFLAALAAGGWSEDLPAEPAPPVIDGFFAGLEVEDEAPPIAWLDAAAVARLVGSHIEALLPMVQHDDAATRSAAAKLLSCVALDDDGPTQHLLERLPVEANEAVAASIALSLGYRCANQGPQAQRVLAALDALATSPLVQIMARCAAARIDPRRVTTIVADDVALTLPPVAADRFPFEDGLPIAVVLATLRDVEAPPSVLPWLEQALRRCEDAKTRGELFSTIVTIAFRSRRGHGGGEDLLPEELHDDERRVLQLLYEQGFHHTNLGDGLPRVADVPQMFDPGAPLSQRVHGPGGSQPLWKLLRDRARGRVDDKACLAALAKLSPEDRLAAAHAATAGGYATPGNASLVGLRHVDLLIDALDPDRMTLQAQLEQLASQLAEHPRAPVEQHRLLVVALLRNALDRGVAPSAVVDAILERGLAGVPADDRAALLQTLPPARQPS